MTATSIPNPLRILGLARILAGAWFVAAGVATLRHYHDLMPGVARLLAGEIGATDAPIRSLLALTTAVILIAIGPVLVAKGLAWMRRLPLPPQGPAAIEPDEVVATLRRHQLPAYADGPTEPYWPLRRWLAEDLAGITGWRREIVSQGVRVFVRSCGPILALSLVCLALSHVTADGLVGPFPAGFVTLLPFVTAIWAGLTLLLIAPNGLRIESVEFPLPAGAEDGREPPAEEITESRPRMLGREPAALGMTLGITGVAVQCLMLSWWNLSYVGYPLLATSIVRHLGSIAGGILFFVLGNRMVTAAAELLPHYQYDSILVLIDDTGHGAMARAAGVRTESRGLTGPRHVLAAVGGVHVRESAQRLIRERADSA